MNKTELTTHLNVPQLQVAALCVRWKKNGKPRILIITSRETKRWIIPKGWPMTGKTYAQAAAIEAWEEAGVICKKNRSIPLVGEFFYTKRSKSRKSRSTKALVYLNEVKRLARKFPEKGQRKLKWVSLRKAETLLSDDGLVKLIKKMREEKFLVNYPLAKGSSA